MLGLMQSRPLLISGIVDYASTWHGGREIVSRDAEGAIHRSTYAEVAARAKRLANALDALGPARGDRVATLAWNSSRHLGIYYGVTSSGRVLHTVNPRLFPDQIQYIMHHAEDAYVSSTRSSRRWSRRSRPASAAGARLDRALRREPASQAKLDRLLRYEDLLAKRRPRISNGRSRREHRLDALLHLRHDRQSEGRALQPPLDGAARARRLCGRRLSASCARDSILIVVPLFHANAWSLPFSAAMCGAQDRAPWPEARPRKPLHAA